MLIRPTGLTLVEIIILLNCAHGSEANKQGLLASKQNNTKFDRHYERGLWSRFKLPSFFSWVASNPLTESKRQSCNLFVVVGGRGLILINLRANFCVSHQNLSRAHYTYCKLVKGNQSRYPSKLSWSTPVTSLSRFFSFQFLLLCRFFLPA